MFGEMKIGNAIGNEPSKLIGRRMEITMRDLTGDIKNQHLKLLLRISEVNHNKAYTKLVGHEISRDYMRSLMRRRSSRIDTNVEVSTKDRYNMRIRVSCFTLKKANHLQEKIIRRIAEETIKNRAYNLEFNKYVQEIILGKLASDIYKNAKRIYPLRRVEVNKSAVISEPMPAPKSETGM